MRVYQFLVFIISVQAFSQLNIDLVELGNNFDKPVDIKHAGDERLFVVEQKGVIKILNPDGTVNSKPFLDINDRVKNLRSSYDERGLLGVAFHPNYKNNGRFYVNYIDNKGDTVIARYLVSSNNPNVANYNSEKTIEGVDQPFSNHNGGDLRFGPDGYLYIATGDGGSGGDPKDSGQDLNSL
ncbi:MAG: PQQ-dependent sugar dehydrogenase [Flavobacteriaceae bacterium]|nr:PQQ-dependent sugar dehydrogenase [Flavobacteriaceae bacterium]